MNLQNIKFQSNISNNYVTTPGDQSNPSHNENSSDATNNRQTTLEKHKRFSACNQLLSPASHEMNLKLDKIRSFKRATKKPERDVKKQSLP